MFNDCIRFILDSDFHYDCSLQDIFTLDHSGDIGEDGLINASLVPTGIRPAFAERLKAQGLPIPARLLGAADPVRALRAR